MMLSQFKTPLARMRARNIIIYLGGKPMTEDGRKQKQRIVERFFCHKQWRIMLLYYYLNVLQLFKQYVLKFQTQAPLIHKLHYEQKNLCKIFLACFIKSEFLTHVIPDKHLDLDNSNMLLPDNAVFKGETVKQILKDLPSSDEVKKLVLNKSKACLHICR